MHFMVLAVILNTFMLMPSAAKAQSCDPFRQWCKGPSSSMATTSFTIVERKGSFWVIDEKMVYLDGSGYGVFRKVFDCAGWRWSFIRPDTTLLSWRKIQPTSMGEEMIQNLCK